MRPQKIEMARRPGAAPGTTSFGDSCAQAGARRTIKTIEEKGRGL